MDLCGKTQVYNGTLCLIRRWREESVLPTTTEENHCSSAPAHASLAESTETDARQSFFLFGVANVGSEIHAMEMCLGCPICPTFPFR